MGFYDAREKRVEVFKDTMKQCKENDVLFNAVTNSIKNQKVYLEESSVPVTESGAKKCETLVSKKRTFEAAEHYAKNGKKVCVLNFASAMSPGGGVVKGSGAQEECLCRCSTLYPAISSAYVEFHGRHKALAQSGEMDNYYNDDCIFTPDVVVFKTDTLLPETMPANDWYKVDVITCAAPHLHNGEPFDSEELFALHKKRMERILQIAALHKAQVLILGAFGCGAFHNPPDIVAKAIKESLVNYAEKFEVVEFAVYCQPNAEPENYNAFNAEFAGE